MTFNPDEISGQTIFLHLLFQQGTQNPSYQELLNSPVPCEIVHSEKHLELIEEQHLHYELYREEQDRLQ